MRDLTLHSAPLTNTCANNIKSFKKAIGLIFGLENKDVS